MTGEISMPIQKAIRSVRDNLPLLYDTGTECAVGNISSNMLLRGTAHAQIAVGKNSTRYTLWDSGNLKKLSQLTNDPGYIAGVNLNVAATPLGADAAPTVAWDAGANKLTFGIPKGAAGTAGAAGKDAIIDIQSARDNYGQQVCVTYANGYKHVYGYMNNSSGSLSGDKITLLFPFITTLIYASCNINTTGALNAINQLLSAWVSNFNLSEIEIKQRKIQVLNNNVSITASAFDVYWEIFGK